MNIAFFAIAGSERDGCYSLPIVVFALFTISIVFYFIASDVLFEKSFIFSVLLLFLSSAIY
jgi:hypothetical protein